MGAWWCWALLEGWGENAFAVLWAVATVAFLLPGDALVQAASSSQEFAQHVLCSPAPAPVQALVACTRNTPPVREEPCETGGGLKSTQGQCAVG